MECPPLAVKSSSEPVSAVYAGSVGGCDRRDGEQIGGGKDPGSGSTGGGWVEAVTPHDQITLRVDRNGGSDRRVRFLGQMNDPTGLWMNDHASRGTGALRGPRFSSQKEKPRTPGNQTGTGHASIIDQLGTVSDGPGTGIESPGEGGRSSADQSSGNDHLSVIHLRHGHITDRRKPIRRPRLCPGTTLAGDFHDLDRREALLMAAHHENGVGEIFAASRPQGKQSGSLTTRMQARLPGPGLLLGIEDRDTILENGEHLPVGDPSRRDSFERSSGFPERWGRLSPAIRAPWFTDLGGSTGSLLVRKPPGPAAENQKPVLVERYHHRFGSRFKKGGTDRKPALSWIPNLYRGGGFQTIRKASDQGHRVASRGGGGGGDRDSRRSHGPPTTGLNRRVVEPRNRQQTGQGSQKSSS